MWAQGSCRPHPQALGPWQELRPRPAPWQELSCSHRLAQCFVRRAMSLRPDGCVCCRRSLEEAESSLRPHTELPVRWRVELTHGGPRTGSAGVKRERRSPSRKLSVSQPPSHQLVTGCPVSLFCPTVEVSWSSPPLIVGCCALCGAGGKQNGAWFV